MAHLLNGSWHMESSRTREGTHVPFYGSFNHWTTKEVWRCHFYVMELPLIPGQLIGKEDNSLFIETTSTGFIGILFAADPAIHAMYLKEISWLLMCVHGLSHVQLCNPTDWSLPGSSVYGFPR